MAVGAWGIQPSEFWDMDVEEWWWLYDQRMPERKYGALTESQVESALDRLEKAQNEYTTSRPSS